MLQLYLQCRALMAVRELEGWQVTLLSASNMSEQGDFESSLLEQKQIIIVRHFNGPKKVMDTDFFPSKT